MLILVHPAPKGQDPPAARRKGRHAPALSLTPDEVRHLRATLRGLARTFGSWAKLAKAMGVNLGTLTDAATAPRYRPSGTLAIRAARVGGMTVEAVLSGTLADAGRCQTCGARVGGDRAKGASEEPRPWPTGGGAA